VGLSKPGAEIQRDRVLSEDEIRAVWSTCDAEPGIIADAFPVDARDGAAPGRGPVHALAGRRWRVVDDPG